MYAILDIETTGGKYNEEGITEIAIYRYDGIEIRDKLVSLINPEKKIQPFVEQLTGINEAMLRTAPKFHEIAKRIVELTENCTLVAHNASFDYRILHNEFKQLGFHFERPTLCTVELSKVLIPDQESYSLGKLCRKLGIPVSDRHRADGDALATLKLLKILLQKDQHKEIISKTIKIGNERDMSKKLLKILESVPKSTGIFYVYNFKREIIYTGKGKSVYQSVNNLFLKNTEKARLIRKEMTSLAFEETGSKLIREIKYLELLHIHRPKYNLEKLTASKPVPYSNPNMILIDKGRNMAEKSVVLIENNKLTGYGFTDLNYQINNPEVLRSLITVNNFTNQFNQLLQKYLKKEMVEKIIRF